jgi:hypothetical protein
VRTLDNAMLVERYLDRLVFLGILSVRFRVELGTGSLTDASATLSRMIGIVSDESELKQAVLLQYLFWAGNSLITSNRRRTPEFADSLTKLTELLLRFPAEQVPAHLRDTRSSLLTVWGPATQANQLPSSGYTHPPVLGKPQGKRPKKRRRRGR